MGLFNDNETNNVTEQMVHNMVKNPHSYELKPFLFSLSIFLFYVFSLFRSRSTQKESPTF